MANTTNTSKRVIPKYTNNTNIPMALAVWLMHDTYDYKKDPNYLSATTLLKPTRMIILSERAEESIDLSSLITSRLGSSMHDAVERAWTSKNLVRMLPEIGFPKKIAERIVINPTGELSPTDIPVYFEQRGYYKYGKYTVGGKFDICIDGGIEDFKNTSVYTYIKGSSDEDYIKQGSIYRLLFPEIVTQSVLKINFVFKDFQQSRVDKDPNYPPSQALQVTYPLMSTTATKEFIHQKVDEYDKYRDADESDLPLCRNEDLWIDPIKYAYFSKATNKAATKVYDSEAEAKTMVATKGGVIKIRGGEPKRCDYCSGQSLCSQYKRMMERLNNGK